MRRFHQILSIVICYLFCCNFAFSNEAKINDILNLNSEIFSLSKKKENAFDAPSATYILSSEEIRRSGATSIPEALRLVPGVQVSKMNGHSYAVTIRGFNRQYSNRILILIDGRTIYNPIFGIPWHIHDYILEDIDRIEVVRGSGTTIWGSQAFNGVINIITKSAVQTQGAYVSQIVGNQDQSITEVRYGGEVEKGDYYRIYAKKLIRDGLDRYDTKQENRDGLKHEMAGFRYDSKSLAKGSFSLHGDIFHNVAQNYFTTLNTSKKSDNVTNGGNLSFSWDRSISRKSEISLKSYFTYEEFRLPVLQINQKIFNVDFQHFYDFTKNNKFIWGVGYRQIFYSVEERSDLDGVDRIDYSPDDKNDQLFTAFIQDRIGLITDKLYLTLGSKFENNDSTGFEYQPNARLAYYPTRNQTLWASVSRTVRTPNDNENGVNIGNGQQQGSTTFESEKLLAYEMGYRIKPTSKSLIDTTIFYNDYSKLRTFEVSGTNKSTAANLGYGESYGFEINGKWQATSKLKLEASYEYLKLNLHISDNSTDTISVVGSIDSLEMAEGQAPENQFKLKSFYNITPKIEFDNFLFYVDNLPSAGPTKGDKGIPSYFRFDTRLGYLPTDNLDLSIGIQNLFDQRHSEFKKSLYNRRTEVGRTVYFKLVWQY